MINREDVTPEMMAEACKHAEAQIGVENAIACAAAEGALEAYKSAWLVMTEQKW